MPDHPTTLQHDVLLGAVEYLIEDCRGSDPLMALYLALHKTVSLHHPKFFAGHMACLACSPGMPPPVLVMWADRETSRGITEALEIDLG